MTFPKMVLEIYNWQMYYGVIADCLLLVARERWPQTASIKFSSKAHGGNARAGESAPGFGYHKLDYYDYSLSDKAIFVGWSPSQEDLSSDDWVLYD